MKFKTPSKRQAYWFRKLLKYRITRRLFYKYYVKDRNSQRLAQLIKYYLTLAEAEQRFLNIIMNQLYADGGDTANMSGIKDHIKQDE